MPRKPDGPRLVDSEPDPKIYATMPSVTDLVETELFRFAVTKYEGDMVYGICSYEFLVLHMPLGEAAWKWKWKCTCRNLDRSHVSAAECPGIDSFGRHGFS